MKSGNNIVDKHDDEMDGPADYDMDYCYDCECSPCQCEEQKKNRQLELEAYCPTFEDFLIEKHSEQYIGTKDGMVEDCEDWMDMLEAHEVHEYAEQYGKACFRQGQKIGK